MTQEPSRSGFLYCVPAKGTLRRNSVTPQGLARTVPLLTALLAWTGCGTSAPISPPIEFHATSAIAAAQLPTARLQVDLTVYGPTPNELHVAFTDAAGVRSELECTPSERDGLECQGDIVARGDNRVTVTYRAADGRLESVEQDMSFHGDEEKITLQGAFDADASLRPLTSQIYRAADSRVVLEVVEPAATSGGLPSFLLTNGSDEDIVVMTQGHVLGVPVRVAEDGSWGPARMAMVGGCGTGVGPEVLSPGMSAPAGEIYAIGGSVPFDRGSYLYVVQFDDEGTLDDEQVSRRVTVRFEVEEALPAEYVERLTRRGPAREEPDLWAGVTPPSRPGLERPAGREGSQGSGPVPLVTDGEDIAGALSTERSRHTYRLDLRPGQQGVVRIFARCTQAPCSAWVGMFSGDEQDFGGVSSRLHRDPPAWSVRERIVRARDEVFVIGCHEECDAGWEFYGRVHVR